MSHKTVHTDEMKNDNFVVPHSANSAAVAKSITKNQQQPNEICYLWVHLICHRLANKYIQKHRNRYNLIMMGIKWKFNFMNFRVFLVFYGWFSVSTFVSIFFDSHSLSHRLYNRMSFFQLNNNFSSSARFNSIYPFLSVFCSISLPQPSLPERSQWMYVWTCTRLYRI